MRIAFMSAGLVQMSIDVRRFFSKIRSHSVTLQTLAEENGSKINGMETFEHPYISKKKMEALVEKTYKKTRSKHWLRHY